MQTRINLLNFHTIFFPYHDCHCVQCNGSIDFSECASERSYARWIFLQDGGTILIQLSGLSLTLIRLNNLIVIVVVGNRIANKFWLYGMPYSIDTALVHDEKDTITFRIDDH